MQILVPTKEKPAFGWQLWSKIDALRGNQTVSMAHALDAVKQLNRPEVDRTTDWP